MKKHLLILISIHLIKLSAFTQNIDSVQVVSEVEVSALKSQYLIANKTQNLDSVTLSSVSGGSLTDLLNENAAVYIKQNAGGLSTIRFRGTSPDHTAILFDGINLNSLTLGHSNMSNIPTFLFDNVLIQYGSTSSLYGTDAIGGSIHLNSKQEWNKGFGLEFQQDLGSFSNRFSGIKFKYSNNKINYKLKVFKKESLNNFTFTNTAAKDFSTGEFYKDTTKNSALRNTGLLQDFNIKISNNFIITSKLWLEDNFHEIQPNMSANFYGGTYNKIRNKHVRAILGFKYYKKNHSLNFTSSFVKDHQVYSDNTDEIISTNSLALNMNYFNQKFLTGKLNSGINFQTIKPDVYAYNTGIQENRLEIFSSYKKTFFEFSQVSLNLRESIVSNYKSQFAPSIATSLAVLNRKDYRVDLTGGVSKSYKIPTFNDRYWHPNGNPDILPESSLSFELGSKFNMQKNKTSLKADLSVYLMQVDNWIQWVNLDIWRPRNIKKVESKGGEISINLRNKFGDFYLQNSANYSLTIATEIDSYEGEGNQQGLQLQYTPKHLANFYQRISYKSTSFKLGCTYTGERFTETYKVLESYVLINSSLNQKFSLKKHHFSLSLKANNILNTNYQNQEYFAMPGRNYTITIKYFINNIKLNKNEQI